MALRIPVVASLTLFALGASFSVQAQTPAPAGDAKRGHELAYTCQGCHSIANYKNVYPTYSVPKLSGQRPEYLVAALRAYKSGERSHGTMHSQASTMSEQDMADVAAYLAGPNVLTKSTNDVPAMIVGERGTGKELVARTIHASSARSSGPFVVLDCDSMPEPVLEVPPVAIDPSPEVAPPPAAPKLASLEILYPKGARVRIDGKTLRSTVPIKNIRLSPGAHSVRVWKGKYKRDLRFEVVAGGRYVMNKRLTKK